MLLALPALARVGYKVNARGCRQFAEGLRLLRDARRRHQLPHLVVLALGADASVTAGQIEQAKKILGPKRKLGLVTPRELGGRAVKRRERDPQRRPARPRAASRSSTGSTTAPGTRTGFSPTACTSPSPGPRRSPGS